MTAPGGGTAARRAARDRSSSTGSRGGGDRSGGASRSAAPSAPSPTRAQVDPDALAALEEERDFLLRSLEDLEREHDAGDVEEDDYVALKDDYTARAAHAIRAIEQRNVAVAAARRPRDWRRTVGVLALVGVVAFGTGWFVFRDAGTRAPGQGLTGDARQDSANYVLQAQALTGQANTALQAGDTAKALTTFQSAVDTYSKALELSPANVQALTYRAWVLHSMALQSPTDRATQLDGEALRGLDEAIALDPTTTDARIFRAILERNLGLYARAKADLDAIDPAKVPPMMTSMVAKVRDDVDAGLAGTTTTTAR